MAHARALRPPLIALLALLPAACRAPLTPPDPNPETALWVPYARADLVTIDRSTAYAVVRDDRSDLLLFEIESRHRSGRVDDRLTWILRIDDDAPLQTPIEVGDDRPASGWLLEEIRDRPAHAAPLRGTVTITQRSAEALSGVVNVYAETSQPTAGEPVGHRVRLARRIEWRHRRPETLGAPELETRGGLTREQMKVEPEENVLE